MDPAALEQSLAASVRQREADTLASLEVALRCQVVALAELGRDGERVGQRVPRLHKNLFDAHRALSAAMGDVVAARAYMESR